MGPQTVDEAWAPPPSPVHPCSRPGPAPSHGEGRGQGRGSPEAPAGFQPLLPGQGGGPSSKPRVNRLHLLDLKATSQPQSGRFLEAQIRPFGNPAVIRTCSPSCPRACWWVGSDNKMRIICLWEFLKLSLNNFCVQRLHGT